MIKGFESITADLTDDEKIFILPRVKELLRTARGRDKAITNKQIVEKLMQQGCRTTGPRVRAVIHHIRTTGLIKLVIGTSEGYYIALTDTEVRDYLDSLESRIKAIGSVRSALARQLMELETTIPLFGEVLNG